MKTKGVHPRARPIELKSNSNKEFILIHGYTGSPTNFNDLPEFLHKKFNATVKVPLLMGHGTRQKDLEGLKFNAFLEQIEEIVERDLKSGKEIIVGGYSLGAQIAIILAAKYPLKGIFLVSFPYYFRFPFNLIGIELLGLFKKYWKKRKVPDDDSEFINRNFHYNFVSAESMRVVKNGRKKLDSFLKDVKCPCLIFNSNLEDLVHHKSTRKVYENISSKKKKIVLFDIKTHNLFYSNDKNLLKNEVLDFFKENTRFRQK